MESSITLVAAHRIRAMNRRKNVSENLNLTDESIQLQQIKTVFLKQIFFICIRCKKNFLKNLLKIYIYSVLKISCIVTCIESYVYRLHFTYNFTSQSDAQFVKHKTLNQTLRKYGVKKKKILIFSRNKQITTTTKIKITKNKIKLTLIFQKLQEKL